MQQEKQQCLGHTGEWKAQQGSWPTTLEDVCVRARVCVCVVACVCLCECMRACAIIRALKPVSHKAPAAQNQRLEACTALDTISAWLDGWSDGWMDGWMRETWN